MSYTKREWATGNVVGAVDLNRIEQGIEDAGSSGSGEVLVVNSTYNEDNGSYTLDKTWQEIYDAFPLTIIISDDNKSIVPLIGINENGYAVMSVLNSIFVTNSSNGYPTTGGKK